ncbi:MAG: CoA transferase [Chloroflexi bacterium]|nr:CoA transferase [Chloroflexota bacterium]
MNDGLLRGYRALDFTDGELQLCGRILGDLGVDVIRVEKPGGDASRLAGPFYHNQIHPEKSLWWFMLNANKRGVTLNLETKDGLDLARRLVKSADFLIESFPPGYLGGLGLAYSSLKEINPGLVMTSITPFGQSGPYQDFKATELTVLALGGFLYGIGDPDRPPVKPNYPLARIASAVHAASATLVANHHQQATGQGQHVDVSTQAGAPWFTQHAVFWWQTEHRLLARSGWAFVRRPDLNARVIWPCKDGHVLFQIHGGVVGIASNRATVQWMAEEGFGNEYFHSFDWDHFDLARTSQEQLTRLEEIVAPFFLSKTTEELAQGSEKRKILLGCIDGINRLSGNPQLASRDFWQTVRHDELGASLTYPAFFALSSAASTRIRRRAPFIGEHNQEVYGGLGLTEEQLFAYSQAGVV